MLHSVFSNAYLKKYQKWKTLWRTHCVNNFTIPNKSSQLLNFSFCSIRLETWKFCKHSFESDFCSSTLSIIETIQKSHLSGSSVSEEFQFNKLFNWRIYLLVWISKIGTRPNKFLVLTHVMNLAANVRAA